MTQQEFVKKESEARYDTRFIVFNPDEEDEVNKCMFIDGHADGLTKGLEIAKEFAEWAGFNYNQESDGWYFMFGDDTKTYTTEELLTIFLTEKYGK